MNTALEFHDSDVESIRTDALELRIRLSQACVHRSMGRPGYDDGESGTQAVEIVLGNPNAQVEKGDCRGRLSDGFTSIAGVDIGLLQLSLNAQGDVLVELAFINGSSYSVMASSIRIDPVGTFAYVEAFPGNRKN